MPHRSLKVLAALMMVVCATAQSAPSTVKGVHIVLVHGALIDGSSWRGVYDVLTRDCYRVSIVQEPLTSFDEDLVATKRVLDLQDGPVVLVGNSYGGQIITVAGATPRSRRWCMSPRCSPTSARPAAGCTRPCRRRVNTWC